MGPVQVTIRDLPPSPVLEDHIRKKADKLNHYYDRINSCRIVITIPQKHKHNGKLFCVRIDLTVPGKELAANHKLNEDVYVAVRDAFHAVQRQLECYARKQRGDVKLHDHRMKGVVKRLFADDGYGFIEGLDGNEYYFSTNNVAHPNFNKLQVNDLVAFMSNTAGDGLQANRITKKGIII